MKNTFLIMILSLFINLKVNAGDSDSLNVQTNKNLYSQDTVIVVGQHILLSDETLKDAYIFAESIAKANAAKRFGEYLEIVKMTDAKTSEVKQVVSTVNATILKYEVIDRSKSFIGDDIVVTVKIKAVSDPIQLQDALDRFYANEEAKKEISLIQSQKKELETQIRKRDSSLAELRRYKENHSSSRIKNKLELAKAQERIKYLENNLYKRNKVITKSAERYVKLLSAYQKSSFEVSSKLSKTKFNKILDEVSELEADYLITLRSLINEFQYNFNVQDYVDPVTAQKKLNLYLDWEVPVSSSQKPFNGGKSVPGYRHMDAYRSDGVAVSYRGLGYSSQDIVNMKYAIFHVINVNSVLTEIPVLLPIESSINLEIPEDCTYGSELKGVSKYRYLCFNFNFHTIAISEGRTIAFDKFLKKDSFNLSFDLDSDVSVSTYFEIREVKSGKSIFTNKKA